MKETISIGFMNPILYRLYACSLQLKCKHCKFQQLIRLHFLVSSFRRTFAAAVIIIHRHRRVLSLGIPTGFGAFCVDTCRVVAKLAVMTAAARGRSKLRPCVGSLSKGQ